MSTRRRSSRSVHEEEPQPGSSTASPRKMSDEKVELLARLLSQIRAARDKREMEYVREFEETNPSASDVEMHEYILHQLSAVNEAILKLEQQLSGSLLEDMLKSTDGDADDDDAPTSDTGPPDPTTDAKPSAMEPIEIKVEDEHNASLASMPSSDVRESQSMLSVTTSERDESNVERAIRQEHEVVARVAELRRNGKWPQSRLPLCAEPKRSKTHWDFLLEEVQWMAADFRQERIFKRNIARKLSTAIARQKREMDLKEEKREERELKEGRRICTFIAKMIREFWMNVDKIVDKKAQEILDAKKRQALDQHLTFIVSEADKLSSMVQEGLQQDRGSSATPSASSDKDKNDVDYEELSESESDDEETIAKAEKEQAGDVKEEMNALAEEGDMDMDAFLASLPPEYLASLGIQPAMAETKGAGRAARKEREGNMEEEADSDDEPVAESSQETETTMEDAKEEEEEEVTTEGESDPKRRRTESPEDREEQEDKTDMKIKEGEGLGDGRGMLDSVDYAKLNSENSDERQQELANIADEALKFQPTGYTLDTAQVKTKTPFLMRGTLREYQLVGLDWLVTLYEKNLNGILADEMGLGKTIQTISLLAHLACEEQIWGPHLIVVPTSVILNWEMEIKKWCPALKILTYFGSQKDRAEKRKGWMKPNSFHVCITSYKTVTQDIRSFKKKAWQYLILDEAQNIKNWKSQRWQALLNVRARRRLLLTGTPLQNSLMELWSLMHFLMPAIFASHDDFKDWFSNPLTGMMEGSVEFNAPLVQRLHKVLRPFILRRLKSEVEKQLPAKTEHVVKCSLSKRQRYLYDDFMSRRSTRDNLKSGNMLSVLNIVMQLRKCCNHPNLFEPRPVVSPLAMPQLEHTVPAPLLNVAETSDERVRQRLPEGLRIADNVCGWTTGIRSGGRPLIEELENHEDSIQPPVVDGFRFKRPAVNKNTDGAAATSVMDVSAEELARAGFGHNEMFLVVGEDDDLESMLRGNGGAPVPVPVRFDQTQGRLVLDSSARNGVARVCRVVTGEDGSKTLRDVAGAAGVASTPEGSQIAAVPGPGGNAPVLETRAASGGDGAVGEPVAAATSVPTRQTRHTTVYRPQQAAPASAGAGTSKKDDVHPGLRSTTVMTPQSPQTTSSAGFHLMMEAGGSWAVESGPLSVTSLQLSPPLKRRKTVRPPIVSGEWKECVPASTIALMEEARAVRLRRAAERFSDHRPMVARELLSVLWKETRRKKERAGDDSWKWDSEDATDRVEAIERLSEQTDRVLNRFCVYVEPALSECARLQPHSAGLPAWLREEVCRRETTARLMLQDAPSSVDSVMLSRRLQFPELRLIEYDCGKLQVLANLLRELFLYKHRCLIFTQMSRMLDVLQAFLSYHGYQYFRLDGTTGIEQRQAMMERFNADPRIFCFILSTRSGGVGVNLTGADTVIFYDSDWNPTMDAQAQDRCHRIGQTRNVSIYRLISERTIEENILKKAMQKRRLGEMAIDEAGFTPDFFKQSDNIRDLFDGEVDATEIAAPTDAPRNQKELDKAMARLEDEQDVAAAKRVTAEATADKAEFDERTGLAGIDTDVDNKYLELIQQLRPIERYAINFLEAEYKPNFEEEVKEAEAMISSKKEEWVRAHEKAMDEDEMEGGDDDLYPGGSLLDEVRKGSKKGPSASASRRKSVVLPVRQSTRQVPKKMSPRKSVSPNKRTPAQSAAVRVLKKAVAGERGRGRPRKVKEESEEPQSDVNTPPPIKRGRGRPRKDSRPCTPQSPAPVAELVSHHAHIARRSGGEDARPTPSTSMPVPSAARPVMRLVSRGTPQSAPAPHSHHQPMRHHMQMPVRARPVGPPRLQSPVTSPQRGLLPVRVIRPGQPPQPQQQQQPQQPVRVLMSPPGQTKKIVRIVRPVGQGGNATASGQRPVQNGSPGNPARFIRMPDGQLRRVVVVQRATRPSLGEYDRPRVSYRRTSSTTDNGGEAEPGPSSQ